MKGSYFKLETFSVHDGDGIRAVVFLSGCPLRCVYCHNPDSWQGGTEIDSEDLVKEVLRYRHFYRKGGVTISGGEPLAQGAFTLALIRAFHREGLSVAVDTSGCVRTEETSDIIREADHLILDVKFATEEEYRRYTGGSLAPVVRFLDEAEGKRLWVRIVIVPGINDSFEALAAYLPLLEGRKVERVEFLPFHTLGFAKYERLGLCNPLKDVPAADAAAVAELEKRFLAALGAATDI